MIKKDTYKNQTLLYQLILLHSKIHYRIFLNVAYLLIKCGANVDKANKYGETPLHLATRLENQNAFRFLIQNGANRFARMKNGETIADLCLQQTINQMADLKWISSHNKYSNKYHVQQHNQMIR